MIYHVGVHNAGNAGDVVIVAATNNLIKRVDENIVNILDTDNQPEFNAPVVVGGGGLFIRYDPSVPVSKLSGWRWNISTDNLKKINHPIIVYAVGFNRFRGQIDYDPVFAEHLKILVEKAAFFSVREKSGIERLEPYIGKLIDKVRYQPCPASLGSKLFGEKRDGKYTVFAPAMDRENLRGDVRKIIQVLREIPELKIALHMELDNAFLKYVDFSCEVVHLNNKPASEVINFYKDAKQVIGMRLHACLIPFGFGVSVIPLISHDKLKDWLIDIGHPEWGVELVEAEKVRDHLDIEQVDIQARDELYNITIQNLEEIRRLM